MQVFEYSDFCLVDNLVLDEKLLLKNINLADSVYSQFEIYVQK